MEIIRTDNKNNDFRRLVAELDKGLAKTDGEEHAFYHQYNGINQLEHCLVIRKENQAIACGAIKAFDSNSMEVKRMYVDPSIRGQGIGTTLLLALEKWAKEMNYAKCVLETGKRQPDAVALYKKNGYSVVDNYGQYKGIENSICFSKTL